MRIPGAAVYGSLVEDVIAGPVVEIDSQVYHGYIVSDKAMKARILHCELKWEIPNERIVRFLIMRGFK